MADIKELIPEFYYLPEFLVNSNHFDLGMYMFYARLQSRDYIVQFKNFANVL